jgi:hypothetical protein
MISSARLARVFIMALLLVAAGGCSSDAGNPRDPGEPVGPEPPPPPPPPPPSGNLTLSVAGGGNNVPERFSSDLWISGGHGYTGTWGSFPRVENRGDALKIWSLDGPAAPQLVDSIVVPNVVNVSDLEVSSDGSVLMFSAEAVADASGLYFYDLAVDPVKPRLADRIQTAEGVHTATFGYVDGRRYVFAAKNGPDPALLIFDATDPYRVTPVASVPIPPHYGLHDTYVRDGIAFAFAWDTGVIIYDVGNGIRGGSVAAPVEVSRLITAAGTAASPAVHNGWWFHNPVTHEARYLFVGQEGPSTLGHEASGDIHVVDVSDLASPREVARFHLDGAGTHNFWMDEANQILYAAYYNGGVVALDVSGTLSGDLSDRLVAQLRPGGDDDTFTWGVMLAGGYLYASDMLSGLWKIAVEP